MSSSPFPSCFRLSPTAELQPSSPAPDSRNANLSTYLYHTEMGLVSLTWRRSMMGRSLDVQLHHNPLDSPPFSSSSPSSFHLHIKPFLFWKKHGSKTLSPNTRLFWNLSNVNFSSSAPEPLSGFSLALLVHNHVTLLLRDPSHHAFSKAHLPHLPQTPHFLLLKRHHILADKVYTTNATFAGQTRQIRIDCSARDHSSLRFSVDGELVLQIKRLKWKFRGNERVLIHGVNVHISWDLYNWLFPKDNNQAHAIFMFKFDHDGQAIANNSNTNHSNNSLANLWNLGVYEWGKVGKSSSSSSVSLASSAGSFGASSSVLEWSSVEENELVVPLGFSLIVYAWKR